jgi:hypothetical protein
MSPESIPVADYTPPEVEHDSQEKIPNCGQCGEKMYTYEAEDKQAEGGKRDLWACRNHGVQESLEN